MKKAIGVLLIAAVLVLTSCSGITVDSDKMRVEYDTGYSVGYAKGFIDGVASCNKTISIGERE